jgi:hypothetical protein
LTKAVLKKMVRLAAHAVNSNRIGLQLTGSDPRKAPIQNTSPSIPSASDEANKAAQDALKHNNWSFVEHESRTRLRVLPDLR